MRECNSRPGLQNVYTERLKGVEVSKKDKLKFKRRIKEQIIQEMGQAQKAPQPAAVVSSPAKQEVPSAVSTHIQTAPIETPTKTTDSLDFVKYDLKKSAIIIGSIIVAIVAIYFIDNKTGFLLKASESLFRVLHINT